MRRRHRYAGIAAAATVVLLSACSTDAINTGLAPDEPGAPPCPVTPIRVVVSVEQWAQPIGVLGGRCVRVRVLVGGRAADPHEFEPSPADLAALERARLVVTNGAGYDEWADRAVDASSAISAHLDAARLTGRSAGDNPHLWFDVAAVRKVAGAAVATLQEELGPDAAGYLAERAAEWEHLAALVEGRLGALRGAVAGRAFLATEPVYDLVLGPLGLVDATPDGYAHAAMNEADPSPADLAAAERVVRDRRVAFVVVNRQTLGAAPLRLQRAAVAAGVPVVEVRETLPASARGSLVAWQLQLLDALAAAVDAP